MALIEVENVTRGYPQAATPVLALRGISLVVAAGEFVTVTGPSGCGKSTLLHIIGGIDRPSSGILRVGGRTLGALSDEALTLYRRREVGFVFQFFHLLPTLRVIENVALPLLLDGIGEKERTERALNLLERVGMAERATHFPSQLSGGEMQRTALARALVTKPTLLIADEPTGNLDSDNGARVLELIHVMHQEARGKVEPLTILLATHDRSITERYHAREISMRDGVVVGAV